MRRILVVEDDAHQMRILGVALRQDGYEVAEATTGYLALSEVARRQPDVILLDLYLSGGMNGREFLDQYRSSGGRAKVIVISGANRSEPIAKNLVVDEFIGKPFDLELLLRSVRRLAYS
ncbi:MAG TPA: response regulator [Candidatus Limnocylindria bacterium]|nr:response regulator [Candidatus Limnocylindria bacterium]